MPRSCQTTSVTVNLFPCHDKSVTVSSLTTESELGNKSYGLSNSDIYNVLRYFQCHCSYCLSNNKRKPTFLISVQPDSKLWTSLIWGFLWSSVRRGRWKCETGKWGTRKCSTNMQGWKLQYWKIRETTLYGKPLYYLFLLQNTKYTVHTEYCLLRPSRQLPASLCVQTRQ